MYTDEAVQVEKWKESRIKRVADKAALQEREREQNILVASEHADLAELQAVNGLLQEIRRLSDVERELTGKAELVRHSLKKLHERSLESEVDDLINGLEPARQRIDELVKSARDIDSQIRDLSDQRAAKEKDLRLMREALRKAADEKRKELLKQMATLLQKAQAMSQTSDDIFFACQENDIELDAYLRGPSMFAKPAVIQAGKRLLRVNSKSRHDAWMETLRERGVL